MKGKRGDRWLTNEIKRRLEERIQCTKNNSVSIAQEFRVAKSKFWRGPIRTLQKIRPFIDKSKTTRE